MRGVQQTLEEIIAGNLIEYCMDKCTKCQRLLRVSSYNQPKDTKFIRKKRRSAGPSQVFPPLF
jgi:hypothetical protein